MFFALRVQAVIVALILLGCWVTMGLVAAGAATYGAAIAMMNSGMLVRRWSAGLKDLHCDGGRHLKSFHRSVMERFFVVGLLLALGFGGLNLAPLEMLSGFLVGQLAWVLANLLARRLF